METPALRGRKPEHVSERPATIPPTVVDSPPIIARTTSLTKIQGDAQLVVDWDSNPSVDVGNASAGHNFRCLPS